MKRPAITFDFDDTLAEYKSTRRGELYVSNGILEPIMRVIKFLQEKSKTHTIHIVSYRRKEDLAEIWEFVHNYALPVARVICTEGESKVPALQELESTLHVDDSVEALTLAEMAGIPGLLVDHGQEKTNSTATLFNKI
jgi:FMN phosphatase YigB (HAD superfamily)